MKAQKELKEATVIDVFSVKPLDEAAIHAAAVECGGKILTVEDHFKEGGIYGMRGCINDYNRGCVRRDGQVQGRHRRGTRSDGGREERRT